MASDTGNVQIVVGTATAQRNLETAAANLLGYIERGFEVGCESKPISTEKREGWALAAQELRMSPLTDQLRYALQALGWKPPASGWQRPDDRHAGVTIPNGGGSG